MNDFTVHHLSNKYVGRVGVDEPEMRRQIRALMEIERVGKPPQRLLTAETKLPDGIYSKDYYERATPEIMALIPKSARSILSIGCGCGATEIALAESGLSVTAVPLDAVISLGAAESGVEMSDADFRAAREQLEGRRFDAILMLNVLHLAPDPAEVLASFSALLSTAAPIIIQSPNMSNLPAIWRQIRGRRIETPHSFAASGTHFSSRRTLKKWCGKAGLTIERATEILHGRFVLCERMVPAAARRFLASDFIATAKCAIPLQNKSFSREPM
jgi:2-polyprenyl-3-methyl-5-hydroxy-6-metoxy-1,4-benzoquinol methylase